MAVANAIIVATIYISIQMLFCSCARIEHILKLLFINILPLNAVNYVVLCVCWDTFYLVIIVPAFSTLVIFIFLRFQIFYFCLSFVSFVYCSMLFPFVRSFIFPFCKVFPPSPVSFVFPHFSFLVFLLFLHCLS